MTLDPITLNVAFVLLALVLGSLLIYSWALNQSIRALLPWGAAFCLIASGFAVANLAKPFNCYPALLVGNTLGLLSYVALYGGSRAFNGRMAFPPAILIGPALWVAVFPFIYERQDLRLIAVTVTTGAYSIMSAWELARHARQQLASRRIAVWLLAVLAIFNLTRTWPGIAATSIPWLDALGHRWSSEMALFLVVFTPTLAFIFLSMAKESMELGYKQAALLDSLTEIPNRRGFMQNAARLVGARQGKPVSCLVFDLDNFKNINDGYGHDTGDTVLRLFGQVMARHLPPQSFGRLGGEEFAAILPMAMDDAAALAEAIRAGFAEEGRAMLGHRAQATVSVGCSAREHATVEALLHEADRALYRAKDQGRDVVIAA